MYSSLAPRNSFTFWKFNLAIWAIFGVVDYGVRCAYIQDPLHALGLTFLQEPLGFLISCLLYLVYRRPALSDPFGFRTAVWLVALSFAAGVLQTSIAVSILEWGEWWTPSWTEREEWLLRLTFTTFIFLTWSLIFFGLQIRAHAQSESQRASKASEEAQRMELQLLRAQLDPHFLFNSLNGIAAEIPPHPDAALQMVRELSDYLRYSLDHRHAVTAPLSSELDAMSAYLKIEKARYGDRLQTSLQAEPEARRIKVPSFLLQPMVENAVKHGMSEALPVWQLNLTAKVSDGVLIIELKHLGQVREDSTHRKGVGLETLQRRLDLHYPSRHRFILRDNRGEICARLELEGEPCFA